ncbi:MAG: hypothetical protein KC910_05945 [Candidatus Eremiobacteraeota bacterium]|nr:hypothetical protein [Candidatus Eremiobacteraeota bacterium]
MTQRLRSLTLKLVICLFAFGFVACEGTDTAEETGQTGGTVATGTTGNGGNTGTGGNTGNGGPGVRQVQARVVLPAGVNLDLGTLTLTSQLNDFAVEGDGQSTILLEAGGRVLAVLFDQNDNPILIGFLTDGQTQLSVRTTVEATLYYALGTALLPEEIRENFFTSAQNLPGFDALVTQAEQLFAANPNFFQSNEYATLIRNFMDSVVPGGALTRLNFDPSARSGLFIEERQGDTVVVVNQLPRRCLALVYKLSFKDEGGRPMPLISDVASENPTPKQEFRVPPAARVDSVLGTIKNQLAGKGIDYARVESESADLGLLDGESEAVHSIRVLGPSVYPDNLSRIENEKLQDLQWESALLDVVLPLMLDAIGQNTDIASLKNGVNSAGDGLLRAAVNSFKVFASSLAGVSDKIREGKFDEALPDLLSGIKDNLQSQAFEAFYEDILEILIQTAGYSPEKLASIDRNVGKFVKILNVFDTILKFSALAAVVDAPYRSSKVEDFLVTTTRNPVTLVPDETIAIQDEPEELRAVVQNGELLLDDGSFEYHWSTTGAYGELRDSLGASGTAFSSSQDRVNYFSGSSTHIPEDAVEEVAVEVYIKQGINLTFVGRATSEVRVRESGFEILPRNVALEGGDSFTLKVQRTDGTNPLDSQFFDYKFIWETQGEYGSFNGTGNGVTSTVSNAITYTALDTEVERAVETVSVRVYSRRKGTSDPWKYLDRVYREIDINNDDTIKVFYVERYTRVKRLENNDLGLTRYLVRHAFAVPMVENATRYSIEIVTWENSGANYLGRGAAWDANDTSRLDEGDFEPPRPNHFIYQPSGGSSYLGDTSYNEHYPGYEAVTGVAKVTVTVSP